MKHLLLLPLFFIAYSSWSQTTPQEKAELAITKHIKNTYSKMEYHGYMFGNLIKITPPEIIELKDYKKAIASLDKKNDSISNHYDSILKSKLKEIRDKKLFSTYEISHFYTLKKKFEKPILYQYVFTLFPDGKVSDVAKHLEYKLTDEEYNYFYYYYMKKDLYNTAAENSTTYSYLTKLYENETKSKESAMSTILTVSKVIYENHVYDTVLISRIEVQKWFRKNFKNNVTISQYSSLKTIKDSSNNEILGYNLFAQIFNNDSIETYYFEFDYDYILRGVLPVKGPFEQYFTQNKEGKENK